MNQLQYPFVHVQNPHELTSRPFCTRAKPSCKRSRTFCIRRKTALQTFKDLLFTTQNRHANVQGPIVHDAKPSCKRSRTDCSRCKTPECNFKGKLLSFNHCFTIKETVGAQGHTPSTYAKLRYNKPRKSFTPLCSHLSFHVRPRWAYAIRPYTCLVEFWAKYG